MTKRNPFTVWLFSVITCGIYAIYWYYVTTEQMKTRGADIPTFILLFIPLVGLFWVWKFMEGVQKVTNGKANAGSTFLLCFAFGIGIIFAQKALNEVE